MELLSVNEASDVLGVSRQRVYQSVNSGELPYARKRPLLLDKNAVEAFAEREKRKGGRPKKETKEA